MTREEIMNEPIWPSRLIFNAKRVTGKIWRECNEEEQFQVRKHILDNL
jgi:hypothetical protein